MFPRVKAWLDGQLIDVRLVQPRGPQGRFRGFDNTLLFGLKLEDSRKVILTQDSEGKLYVMSEA